LAQRPSQLASASTISSLHNKLSQEFRDLAAATQSEYLRYLSIIQTAWGALLVSGVRPKNVLTLRDAWASTPVAANHLVSVTKTLINWGIPREFSDSNPCAAIAKLATDEGGARPWAVWAYGLIEEHAREDIRRAVWLARHTGQRQADVIRMSKGRSRGWRHQGYPTEDWQGALDTAAQRSKSRDGRLAGRTAMDLRTDAQRWRLRYKCGSEPPGHG
jgi:hypothetical protein